MRQNICSIKFRVTLYLGDTQKKEVVSVEKIQSLLKCALKDPDDLGYFNIFLKKETEIIKNLIDESLFNNGYYSEAFFIGIESVLTFCDGGESLVITEFESSDINSPDLDFISFYDACKNPKSKDLKNFLDENKIANKKPTAGRPAFFPSL